MIAAKLNEIMIERALGKITKAQFLQLYAGYFTYPTEDHCHQLIKQGIEAEDGGDIAVALFLIFSSEFRIDNFKDDLCRLLPFDWHDKHEDIAMLLKDINAPSSVDSLYNAVELQFGYLNYDDTYQFARKCIKAISAIGDDNAVSKLWLLSESKNDQIADYAKKELTYKGLL